MKTVKIRQKLVPWMFMLPALIILGVFTFYPIIYSIPLAFMKYSVIGQTSWVGLQNFTRAFQDSDFWVSLGHSAEFVIVVPILQLISIYLATVVNKPLPGVTIFRVLFYIPVVTSMVAVGIMWGFILDPTGLINTLMQNAGFSHVIYFMNNSHLTLPILMGITIWQGIGYYMMMYLGGLQGIPSELSEAAEIDGASPATIFFKITIPLLKPFIWVCSLMSLIAALGVFDIVFVMTQGGPNNATLVTNYYSYNQAFGNFNFGYGAAVGLLLSIVITLFSVILFVYQRKGGQTHAK
ncbi:carbohydrate ABC transporter permease [Lacticaseibacillus hegangensis]|uniref:Carbohydrate ABC transporter permease n=2 Tax=Lacticaseibacillus hegangensis TaxID=2486010 RepID=A0ABW4CRN3_9LACO